MRLIPIQHIHAPNPVLRASLGLAYLLQLPCLGGTLVLDVVVVLVWL